MKKNCQVKCDLSIKCQSNESLQYVNSSCCPRCVACDLCPLLNYNICDIVNGFKPIKQEKTVNECCDTIICISDPDNNEELTISIGESNDESVIPHQQKYLTRIPPIDSSIHKNLRPIASFHPSQKDSSSKELQDNDYSQENENFDVNESEIEIYFDSYQGKNEISFHLRIV